MAEIRNCERHGAVLSTVLVNAALQGQVNDPGGGDAWLCFFLKARDKSSVSVKRGQRALNARSDPASHGAFHKPREMTPCEGRNHEPGMMDTCIEKRNNGRAASKNKRTKGMFLKAWNNGPP